MRIRFETKANFRPYLGERHIICDFVFALDNTEFVELTAAFSINI